MSQVLLQRNELQPCLPPRSSWLSVQCTRTCSLRPLVRVFNGWRQGQGPFLPSPLYQVSCRLLGRGSANVWPGSRPCAWSISMSGRSSTGQGGGGGGGGHAFTLFARWTRGLDSGLDTSLGGVDLSLSFVFVCLVSLDTMYPPLPRSRICTTTVCPLVDIPFGKGLASILNLTSEPATWCCPSFKPASHVYTSGAQCRHWTKRPR